MTLLWSMLVLFAFYHSFSYDYPPIDFFLFNKSLAFTQMHNKYFYCFNLNYITRYENKKDDTIQTINLYRIVFLPIIILSSSLPMM